MTAHALLLCGAYFAVLLALALPLGGYCARVLGGEATLLGRWLGPLERGFYRLASVDPEAEMSWRDYGVAVLTFNLLGVLLVYGLQRLQHLLPLNPQELGPVAPDLAFNTAVSFASNTNWQAYGGETTLSYFTQMVGLTAQNFVSAATGIAVLAALARGFARRRAGTIGNFWVDLVRATLYVLLPLSLVLAVALAADGVVQTFAPAAEVELMRAATGPEGQVITQQTIPLGPGASQIAIKQLGTNGGGFYNVNSAHPLENPTPVSNFLECLAILLIPAALCLTFGKLVGDRKQGWALLGAMFVVFVPLLALCVWSEGQLAPQLVGLGVDPSAGNLEGKELRFGAAASALWATATTAASNGSVNAMHDSFNPLGGLVPMWLMQIGEVVFGGAGSGLYGMLVFAVLAVFLAGLMVGRTPEYLGKKIEAFEVKMAALVVLLPSAGVLVGTAIAVTVAAGRAGVANPGAHGFSEVLYGFSSAANNNGSAFAGLAANSPFYNLSLGLCMLLGRFGVIVPVLALAGALARKQAVPPGPGTMPTHTPLFVFLLAAVVVLVGALTFVPALALGPIVEHLQMTGTQP
ncbi:potassium-transporting ATPase subunit KdpA [Nannocystis radixulma]|uniref:Potassium-transporting ATPase potassium-binding subunit n=1 Tax=Nannocystis radixulma TaxID=2995305 RepID=A0ABT5BJW7_9BACT|nr:potassium-transporting ATPase subunit KdpA [Nannocystis radixulma]MDC0673983.1 potassium-transporting ATPase subunit KdpA [Nannocystis radixulma]